MFILFIVSAGLGNSLIDVSPPRSIGTSATNVTLFNVGVSGDRPALVVLADLYFGG